MTSHNGDYKAEPGEMRYWVAGHWRSARSEAIAIGERLRADVWAVPDGLNPSTGYLVLRWATIF